MMKGKYPETADVTSHLDVQGAPPKASGYQRLSEKEQEVVNQYVENLVAADVVEPCSGQWSSPILLVPKKDGSLRAVAKLLSVLPKELLQVDQQVEPGHDLGPD